MLTTAAKKRLAKCKAKNLCVACYRPIGTSRVVRGCHEYCHRQTLKYIRDGKLNEADRIRNGRLLECDPGGRPVSNPVTKEVK